MEPLRTFGKRHAIWEPARAIFLQGCAPQPAAARIDGHHGAAQCFWPAGRFIRGRLDVREINTATAPETVPCRVHPAPIIETVTGDARSWQGRRTSALWRRSKGTCWRPLSPRLTSDTRFHEYFSHWRLPDDDPAPMSIRPLDLLDLPVSIAPQRCREPRHDAAAYARQSPGRDRIAGVHESTAARLFCGVLEDGATLFGASCTPTGTPARGCCSWPEKGVEHPGLRTH